MTYSFKAHLLLAIGLAKLDLKSSLRFSPGINSSSSSFRLHNYADLLNFGTLQSS